MFKDIMNETILVTGGAGFIGSALIRFLINETDYRVVNLDKLTYAGNWASLASVADNTRYDFVHGDICDKPLLEQIFSTYQPHFVMHLAAESHVDNSIASANNFIQTNIVGTYTLLEVTRTFYNTLSKNAQSTFRFLHVSTDEIYGDLQNNEPAKELNRYQPSSPYSASKASADHLVRAWHRTYQLPVLLSSSSNNYGPYQHQEKLIPLMINKALKAEPLPIYGDGKQVRDWLYVDDHVRALLVILTKGHIGETYNISAHCEKENIAIVHLICDALNTKVNNKQTHLSHVNDFKQLISYVDDRPGHDTRYALNANKLMHELNWRPQVSFTDGLEQTIDWYLFQ